MKSVENQVLALTALFSTIVALVVIALAIHGLDTLQNHWMESIPGKKTASNDATRIEWINRK